jgi:predicted alpha/beta superfamily hydrolase
VPSNHLALKVTSFSDFCYIYQKLLTMKSLANISFLSLFVFLFSFPSNAQIRYIELESEYLQGSRRIKLQLPRNYEKNRKKEYPVILVFDADYLFEPVAGMVDYLSFWEEIPESFVVGIMQGAHRENDMMIDEDQFLPVGVGEDFFDFIELELMKYMQDNYRTTPLSIAIGHNDTANFANFFVFKKVPLFQGYINLSPRLSPKMASRMAKSLDKTSNRTWFYLANGTDEIKEAKKEIKDLAVQLNVISNPLLTFSYDEFKDATHYTVVSQAIPVALQKIFSSYQPITTKEFEEVLLVTPEPVKYLEDKYYDIAKYYGLSIEYRINDLMYVFRVIEETSNWGQLIPLAKLAKKAHPDSMMDSYFQARYYQETGEPKKALKHYQDAYGFDEVGALTKELMLIRADEIKEVFGY